MSTTDQGGQQHAGRPGGTDRRNESVYIVTEQAPRLAAELLAELRDLAGARDVNVPIDPNEHQAGFPHWEEGTKHQHLIEHGNWLRGLRELDDDELTALHDIAHAHSNQLPEPPDLTEQADKAVRMAAGLREHVIAGRWADAYAAADWLADLADTIHSHVWAAHPEARPETW